MSRYEECIITPKPKQPSTNKEKHCSSNKITSIEELPWYHGQIPRSVAENALLATETEGLYLLRKSIDNSYSISVRSQNAVMHYKIIHFKDENYYVFGGVTFFTINDLVEHFESKPIVGTGGNLTTKFLYPYNRNQNEPSRYNEVTHQVVIGKEFHPSTDADLKVVSASKEGYLTKRGQIVKNWKERWFVVNKNLMRYYDTKKDTDPLKTIDLKLATEVADDCIDGMEYCFRLVVPKRTFYFVASNPDDAKEWKDLLNWKIEYYQKKK